MDAGCGGAICEALARCGSLTSLDLGQNQLGPEAAEKLAEGLRRTRALRDLSLDRNALESEGACAIAKVRCSGLLGYERGGLEMLLISTMSSDSSLLLFHWSL